jgi:hypothetical protein
MKLLWLSITGDIGGSIGLYLGGSLLTLMELLDLLLWVCTRRKARNKIIHVAEKPEQDLYSPKLKQ